MNSNHPSQGADGVSMLEGPVLQINLGVNVLRDRLKRLRASERCVASERAGPPHHDALYAQRGGILDEDVRIVRVG